MQDGGPPWSSPLLLPDHPRWPYIACWFLFFSFSSLNSQHQIHSPVFQNRGQRCVLCTHGSRQGPGYAFQAKSREATTQLYRSEADPESAGRELIDAPAGVGSPGSRKR